MRPSAFRPAQFARIATLAAVLAGASSAAAEGVSVPLDQVQRIHLRGSASDVVIGNPQVAEVAMIDSRTLVITGKRQGTTSMVVLDGARRVLFEGPISVGARAGHVAMVRGSEGGRPADEKMFTCYGVCTPNP